MVRKNIQFSIPQLPGNTLNLSSVHDSHSRIDHFLIGITINNLVADAAYSSIVVSDRAYFSGHYISLHLNRMNQFLVPLDSLRNT